MTMLEIIQLICLAVISLTLVIYFIIKAIKNKWVEKLTSCIEVAIAEAEKKWPEGNGDKKLKYVLNAVKDKCNKLGIPYTLLYKLIKKLVDKIIEHYNVIAKDASCREE